MQVICTDGTTFTCQGYETTEYGVALYGQNLAQEKERYDSEPEQVGYVPHDRLWYILPDGVRPNIPGLSVAQGQPRQGPAQLGQSPTAMPRQAQTPMQRQPGPQ